jgi:hypothetical protein
MVRQKDAGSAGAGRSSAGQKLRKKNRHYNDRDRPYIPTAGLVAKPTLPKSKHKTILEWTENTDKKKKLEIEVGNAAARQIDTDRLQVHHKQKPKCKLLIRSHWQS